MSFLKLTQELKELGIKNNKFILQLNDPKLIGVDPYDKNLSIEMVSRIQNECYNNFWYYIREVIRIPVPGGSLKYEIHRGNLAESFALLNNMNSIVILPRQHYKTISAVVFYSWVYLIVGKNYSMIFSNKVYADSQLNIKRLNDCIELLPDYLKLHLNPKVDVDNKTQVTIASSNNTITALSTAKNSIAADKLGRGMTLPVIWLTSPL